MTGKLSLGVRLVQPKGRGCAASVIFRGFGAVPGEDDAGRPQYREVALVEREDTGAVVKLPVEYLADFEVEDGRA